MEIVFNNMQTQEKPEISPEDVKTYPYYAIYNIKDGKIIKRVTDRTETLSVTQAYFGLTDADFTEIVLNNQDKDFYIIEDKFTIVDKTTSLTRAKEIKTDELNRYYYDSGYKTATAWNINVSFQQHNTVLSYNWLRNNVLMFQGMGLDQASFQIEITNNEIVNIIITRDSAIGIMRSLAQIGQGLGQAYRTAKTNINSFTSSSSCISYDVKIEFAKINTNIVL